MSQEFRVGVVTVSGRASRRACYERSGPAVHAALDEWLEYGWVACAQLVPDERSRSEAAISGLADGECCALVVRSWGSAARPW